MAADQSYSALQYAVRIPVVMTYFGLLMLVVAVMTSATLTVSLVTGNYQAAWRYLATMAGLGVPGYLLARWKRATDLQMNEALVVVGLAFIAVPLALSWPMMSAGLSFSETFFEAVSAVTTTGLSTLPTVEDMPAVFLFSRAWLQWGGGLGIVILTLAILARPGMTSRRLVATETELEDLVGGTRSYARRMLMIYLALTVSGVFVCIVTGMAPFDALLHILASVSTGGFSSHDTSLMHYPFTQQAAVILMCFSGAISLALYAKAYHGGLGSFFGDFEARTFFIVSLLGVLALTGSGILLDHMPAGTAVRRLPFMALSAQTTAGFNTMNTPELGSTSKLILIFSMFTGGMVGSTAGGIKIFRLLVFVRILHMALVRTCLPRHAVAEPKISGRVVPEEDIRGAALIVALFLGAIAMSWLAFLAHGYAPLDSLFEVASAMGTVGLSSGITGPELEPVLKGVLCADMLFGRLEFLALLVVLYPRTWIGRRMQ